MSTQTSSGYTIMEAAKLSGLPESTLRYYESIGIIDPIRRDASSKNRVYSEDDLDLIVAVACLNATGMSIDDMRAYMHNRTKGMAAAGEQIGLLESQKRRLVDESHFLKLRQQYVDTKIRYWQAVASGDEAGAKLIGKEASALAKEMKNKGE